MAAQSTASAALVTRSDQRSGRRMRGLWPWPWQWTPTTDSPRRCSPSRNSLVNRSGSWCRAGTPPSAPPTAAPDRQHDRRPCRHDHGLVIGPRVGGSVAAGLLGCCCWGGWVMTWGAELLALDTASCRQHGPCNVHAEGPEGMAGPGRSAACRAACGRRRPALRPRRDLVDGAGERGACMGTGPRGSRWVRENAARPIASARRQARWSARRLRRPCP